MLVDILWVREMIIVRIWEGLGNQLFQYAYARALQERMDKPVYLDIRRCNRGDMPYEKEDIVKRKLGLQNFCVSLKCVSADKVPFLHCLDGGNCIRRAEFKLMKKGMWRWRWRDDEGRMGQLCQDILKPRDYTYVSAHCLNKGYYENIREILLQELRLKKKIVINQTLAEMLESGRAVSVHIRLTDYLRNPRAICSQAYYDNAVRYIKERTVDPCFIIFSDNPQMAEARYKFEGSVYWVGKEEYSDYEAMMIMAGCRHNVIAESTFSYWGAWLNQNPEKIVIASRKWFQGSMYDNSWRVF